MKHIAVDNETSRYLALTESVWEKQGNNIYVGIWGALLFELAY